MPELNLKSLLEDFFILLTISAKCGQKYTKHQGQYPVIFLTFKDVKFETWEATLEKIGGLLQTEFGRHKELLESNKIADYEKAFFSKILNGNVNFIMK